MVKAVVRFDYPALKAGERRVISAQPTRIFRGDEFVCRDAEQLLLHGFFVGSGKSQLVGRQIEVPVQLDDKRLAQFDTCFKYLPMSIEIEAERDLPAGTVFLRGVTPAVEPFDLTRT